MSNEEKFAVTNHLVEKLTETLLAGDASESELVLQEAYLNKFSALDIYQSIFVKAMNRIGMLWHTGEITIAHEHRASEIVMGLTDKVADNTPHLSINGFSALVACVEDENHVLGAKLFSSILEINGWVVHYLGSSMPAVDLKSFSEETAPDAIILTATSTDRTARVYEALDLLSDLNNDPVILLGGSGVSEEKFSDQLVAQDLSSGLDLLEKNLNIGTDLHGLEQVLIGIGNNIQNLRKARGMNQGQLADIAGVDRAYISLVENGKQNLTLGALVKLSESLSVPVSALVPTSTRGIAK